jgi:hypothetical protein
MNARCTRRELLRVGTLTPLSLGLAGLLAGRARGSEAPANPRRRPAKACILVYLEGGPSHIDLWDMKPTAPVEVRGEFRPIRTRTPGVVVCEHLPRLAQQLHHLAQIRSVTHTITDHNAGSYFALTGRYPVDGNRLVVSDGPANFPPYGAVLAKLRPTGNGLPDFIHVPEVMSNLGFNIPGQSAGFLGPAYDPFVTGDPSLPDFRVPGLTPLPEVSLERLGQREELLRTVDRQLGRLAESPGLERLSVFHRQAARMLGTPAVRRAFDLDQEPRSVRERYGVDPGWDRELEARQFGGLPQLGQSMLLARRLIEAGVRLVTVVTGRRLDQAWDTHRQHFPLLKRSLLPFFDQAFSALLEDLALRGLLEETLVVAMGEFGRTPKLGYITSNAGADREGRDHWPYCYTVFLGGAGLPGGLVVGASDRQGGYPSRDPVTPHDIAATIYAALGIPADTEIHDNLARPHALVQGQAIRALVGS